MMRYMALLFICLLLLVAASTLSAQNDIGETGGTYTVVYGDTLDTIGQKLNVSVEALKAANDLYGWKILRAGDTLAIPPGTPPYGEFPVLRAAVGEDGQGGMIGDDTPSYVFQPGDTLETIAVAFDISLAALINLNGVTNTLAIQPGTLFYIPDGPPYGTYPALRTAVGEDDQGGMIGDDTPSYVFQPGDTLDTIAQAHNVSVEALIALNGVTNTLNIQPGTVFFIPDGPPYGVVPASTPIGEDGQGGGGDFHVVQPNDTLDTIAASYNVQTACLASANDITNTKWVYDGDVIEIDRTCPPYDGFDFVGNK